jgi:hypothetical protein
MQLRGISELRDSEQIVTRSASEKRFHRGDEGTSQPGEGTIAELEP